MQRIVVLEEIASAVVTELMNTFYEVHLLSGRHGILDFLNQDEVQRHIEQDIRYRWLELVNVTENPYWELKEVSAADFSFLFRRILRELEPLLRKKIHHWIESRCNDLQESYAHLLEKLQEDFNDLVNTAEKPSSIQVEQIHIPLHHLERVAVQIEKTRSILIYCKDYETLCPAPTYDDDYEKPSPASVGPASPKGTQSKLEGPVSSKGSVMGNVNPVGTVSLLKDTGIYEGNETKGTGAAETIPQEEAGEETRGTDDSIREDDETNPSFFPTEAVFKRAKLSGGIVVTPGEERFLGGIPEGAIRKLELSHGDHVLVRGKTHSGRLQIDIIERRKEQNPDRIEIPYCLISSRTEAGKKRFYIESRLSGGRRIPIVLSDESTLSVCVREDDERFFSLEEGDLVDIAFWSVRPKTMKVIWKYRQTSTG